MISTTIYQDDDAVMSSSALDEDGEALLAEYHNLLTSGDRALGILPHVRITA